MKLKKYLLTSVVLGLASLGTISAPAFAASTPAQTVTVAVVNYDQLVQSSKAFTDSAKIFNDKFQQRNNDLEALGKELSQENSELEKLKQQLDADLQGGKLTGSQLKSRETAFNQKAQAFEKKYTDYQAQVQQLQREMNDFQNVELDKVDKTVRDIVAKYAAEQKISIIVDSRAAIYYVNAVDVTPQILKLVQ
ncbi:hypothetical protein CJP74_02820 [Psittacicella melopsittaci]|uniref:Periplasmic chaperone for outer membrane proteins Skp n=1 Tax=Psittacicella melopsittaci TaxID=2028576 RepID=A0A3A1Y627_9GAMM|nr:OmpH family outer membrane protein [Psittacicella melopsittaci]RIY33075.1 hypothetical protein CJP74_02820 [Psittacicella melopsittaci]